jgi:hypothetical protein
MQRILIIDGNYFCHRTLGALNMGDKVNNLESLSEQKLFTNELNKSIVSLIDTFIPYVENVIFVNDNNSWRKLVEPHKPYYIKDSTVLGYKENRKEKKEKSTINYNNFNILIDNFFDSLKSRMITFNIEGLEGDDNMMLLSNKIKTLNNVEAIVFGNDSDLNQIVNNNVMLMRNIRSKDCPEGEFVITFDKYKQIFQSTTEQEFLGVNDSAYYRRLFGMSLFSKTNVNREFNAGISLATPYKIALEKSICGDPKDNIFSILSWPASTGTKMFKLTENILTKVLEKNNLKFSEGTSKDLLLNQTKLKSLVIELAKHTNQTNIVKIDELCKHLVHNMKINILTVNNIPKDLVDIFNENWNGYENQILTEKFDLEKFKQLTFSTLNKVNDNASNIMESSIPDIEEL